MTAELKSLSASLTAPKLPDNLFTVTDIDAELSKVRDDESDFIAADFSRLICAETDFSAICFRNCLFHGCRFTACDFSGCTFIDCVFKGCDISNSDLSDMISMVKSITILPLPCRNLLSILVSNFIYSEAVMFKLLSIG